jgi:hypothetical protein
MTRRRVHLLIAAVGIAGLTAGVLNGTWRDRALHELDWGNELTLGGSNVAANRIRIVAPFDADERRFSYYTGGHSPGSGEPSAAPERVIAEAEHGLVTVRLRAFDPYTRERGGDEAAEIAKIVSLATTRVWPARPTPVQVDVHFMPDDAPFSLAKRVDWREGDPYVIAVFARDGAFGPGTAAHELYHVFAGRWALGRNDPAARARPNAAWAYEEVAAELYGQCGRLLANGSLALDTRTVTVTRVDQRFEGVLDDEEIGRALDLLSRDAPGSHGLRDLLARTVLAEAFDEEAAVVLDSHRGERVVARCRELAANPMLLEFRLAEMLETSGTQPEPRPRGD